MDNLTAHHHQQAECHNKDTWREGMWCKDMGDKMGDKHPRTLLPLLPLPHPLQLLQRHHPRPLPVLPIPVQGSRCSHVTGSGQGLLILRNTGPHTGLMLRGGGAEGGCKVTLRCRTGGVELVGAVCLGGLHKGGGEEGEMRMAGEGRQVKDGR
jgi:hypothetical protein